MAQAHEDLLVIWLDQALTGLIISSGTWTFMFQQVPTATTKSSVRMKQSDEGKGV